MSTHRSSKVTSVARLAAALSLAFAAVAVAQAPFTATSAAPAQQEAAAPAPMSLTGPADVQPLEECKVVARVNSEVILACELDWQMRLMFEQRFGPERAHQMMTSPQFAPARDEVMKGMIVSRIEMALLYADFRSKAPQADLASIKKQIDIPFEETEVPRLIETLQVEDRAALEAKLLELGTSLNERREDFHRTMIARSWLQQAVKIDREVTHEQLIEFYREHESDYDQPERVRWEELMVRFDKHPSKSEAYAALALLGNEAYAAAQAASAGEPAFAAIAPTKSDGFTADDGGAYDWTTQGSLASEQIDRALFDAPVGEMSPILEGPMGFHIVRVIERREAGPTPFRDVQAKIREDLFNLRRDQAINEKMSEMKRNARLWTVFTGDMSYEQLAEITQTQRK
ncbi:peptidylprolyl isomerase [Botrimarina mediterranea]|uniref:Peptidylprolyl isomerase n=1 Tax=Botrimarina mediterranea TaxID=2528022 RepID=A0A518K363_9BACT|nr:peptidylprolyl isomerase [Botrimarina mediterranea]QDV72195.1 peptidylprolyl isomerase [Botrimarina mediterranea]QDV76738.1 peptidylprolyl isomerase [Planctomycetes bacterium K2D]